MKLFKDIFRTLISIIIGNSQAHNFSCKDTQNSKKEEIKLMGVTQNPGNIQGNLHQIQGNIIGGFNKDYQTFLFLKFNNPEKGRQWLGQVAPRIATSEEVTSFNKLFKAIKHRSGREGVVKATWMNIAFTHAGLKALQVSQGDLDAFPDDFKQGLAARAAEVGDFGTSAPTQWVKPFGSTKDVHAILILASDSPSDLNNALVDGYINDPMFSEAVSILFTQEGRTRVDDPGHEHFGFKDGISQPGIRGITEELADDPNKGTGHEDLLYPGEFVLGYPTQSKACQNSDGTDIDGVNPQAKDPEEPGPEWKKNGSYLVFRRLSQDVQAFRNMVQDLAQKTGLDPAVMGAKLVGRYESGAPLEQTEEQVKKYIDPTLKDPSIDDPSLLGDDKINDFEYRDDLAGKFVPRAAHIRKTYPRDQKGGVGSTCESETQTHRLLRRGIPFGNSLDAPEHGEADAHFPHDRGLLFLAYQRSIKDQFEFVQSAWVNDPKFPCPAAKENPLNNDKDNICTAGEPDGQDPIIAQSHEGKFGLPLKEGSGCPVKHLDVQHFVTTTGGEYFFQPSIDAIYKIACKTPPKD